MILLDTNVISEAFSRSPSEQMMNWLNAQESSVLFLPTIVFSELYFGAYLVIDERRQESLLQAIGRVRGEYEGRILGFGESAAEAYGRIAAAARRNGRPIETKDAMIAAICLVHGATLATRNMRDFEQLDLRLVNPFEAGA